MSFVGKILILVQVVLTILFMAFAGAVFATHESWKLAASKATALADQRRKEADNAQAEARKIKDDSKKQEDLAKAEAQRLTAENRDLSTRVATLTQENDTLKTAATVKNQLAAISGEDNESRQMESRQLREVMKKAIDARDDQFKVNSDLRDKLTQLGKEFNKLNDSYKVALKDNATFQKALAANKLSTDAREYERLSTPAPVVQGIVMDARKSKDGAELVEISLGSDDGVIAGHQMYVYRSGLKTNERPRYLGKLQIVNTFPDRSIGLITDKSKNGMIQKGDDVTTKL